MDYYGLKILILLFSGSMATTIDPPEILIQNASYTYTEGDRYFLMADAQGQLHMCDIKEPEDEEYISKIKELRDRASFFLYTRNNYNQPNEIRTDDMDSLNKSYFDPRKQTKIIVHGWRSNGKNIRDTIKNAFLTKLDVNVILVDWGTVASGLYLSASYYAPDVAEALAKFLKFIYSGNVHGAGIHMVGHSLGGQIVGITGRFLGGELARITALDPALPLWGSLSGRIRSSDAQYVEIIHTNAYRFGQYAAIGDVDFYPNGGQLMIGCGLLDFGCSHSRSYDYFAESVRLDNFVGTKCKSMTEAIYEKCKVGGDSLTMGNTKLWKPETGVFYLTTNGQPPYGKG